MTAVETQLKDDMKTAMKARDQQTLGAVRMLISALKNKAIDAQRDLTDEDVVAVLSTEAKKRREAAQAFRDGGRDELADNEEAELAVIQKYLPQQLTDDEVAAMVDEVIAATGAESPRDMGKVMGQIMPKLKGRYDGSKVKDLVLAKLK